MFGLSFSPRLRVSASLRRSAPLLLAALASLFFIATSARVAQAQILQEPPPPMPKPKPKPQPTPKDEDYEVVRVTSNLVVVPVSVTNALGQPVQGLKLSDFHLDEEGRAQEIAQMGDPEQVPLDIAILLDVSGSVNARFDFEKEAAARFLKQVLKPEDRASIFAIDQTPRLEQTRDTSSRAAAKLLSIPSGKGATAFYDSVTMAAKYLAQNTPPQRRRVIVVISDGEDNFSNRTRDIELATYRALQSSNGPLDKQTKEQLVKQRDNIQRQALLEVQTELQRSEAVFYSINPSGESLHLNIPGVRAQAGMAQLAESTGGNAFVPDKLENLDAVFQQISAELRSQYLLQYYSNNEAPGNKFLHIKVTLPSQPSLHVRAREGYYPKGKR